VFVILIRETVHPPGMTSLHAA